MAHMIPAQPKEFTAASQEGAVFEALLAFCRDDFYVLSLDDGGRPQCQQRYTVHECDLWSFIPRRAYLSSRPSRAGESSTGTGTGTIPTGS